jgi:class 3 adenylate cyclase
MAEAGPGEVLVSRTVKDLTVGSDIAFEGRGAREHKGVPGEWELFAVTGAWLDYERCRMFERG